MKWISVKDRLPTYIIEVLVTDQIVVGCARYIHYENYWIQPHPLNEKYNMNITHWMPLPEPPKE